MICTECSRPVKPVVGVDCDGTTADYHSHFIRFAGEWLGEHWTTVEEDWIPNYHGDQELSDFLGLDKRTYREIKLAYRQGGRKRCMPLMPYTEELFGLFQQLGLEVWITTTRPYLQMGNVDTDTREWLRRHNLAYDYLIFDDHKYARLAEQVGPERVVCVLEDLPQHFNEADSLGLNPMLVRTRYNYMDPGVRNIHMVNIADGLQEAMEMVARRLDIWKETNGTHSHH